MNSFSLIVGFPVCGLVDHAYITQTSHRESVVLFYISGQETK